MSLYKNFKTDKKAESDGAWFTVSLDDNGKPIRFLISRAGPTNPRFTAGYNRYVKPKNKDLQNSTMGLDELQKLLVKLYAEVIVLGWENVQDEKGKDLPFSQANAEKLMADLPDLFEIIVDRATNMEGFRQESISQEAQSL